MTKVQCSVADDIDIGLGKLSRSTFLGSFSAPDFLDLIPTERESEIPGVFSDVPRKRHCQIEVQCEPRGVMWVWRFGFMDSRDRIDLFIDFAFTQQCAQWLNRPGFNIGKTVEFEDFGQCVEHMEFHKAIFWQPFVESRKISLTEHIGIYSRYSRVYGSMRTAAPAIYSTLPLYAFRVSYQ